MATLIFVYAADSGLAPAVFHVLHKIVSPSTYPCSLCALTYGTVSERPAWKKLIAELPVRSKFLHRDEFRQVYDREVELPAAFLDHGDRIESLITKDEINGCASLEALIVLVRERVRATSKATVPT